MLQRGSNPTTVINLLVLVFDLDLVVVTDIVGCSLASLTAGGEVRRLSIPTAMVASD